MRNCNVIKWQSVYIELPLKGVPVLLSAKGKVQEVTFILVQRDPDSPEYFEFHYSEHDDNCRLIWSDADHWAYLPSAPRKGEIFDA